MWDVSNEDLPTAGMTCVLPAGQSQPSRGPAVRSLFISHESSTSWSHLWRTGRWWLGLPHARPCSLTQPIACGQATRGGSSSGKPFAATLHAAAPCSSIQKASAAGASTPAAGPSPGLPGLPVWHMRQQLVRAQRSGGAAMAVAGSLVVTALVTALPEASKPGTLPISSVRL